jgi:signal transduction histidine kinase
VSPPAVHLGLTPAARPARTVRRRLLTWHGPRRPGGDGTHDRLGTVPRVRRVEVIAVVATAVGRVGRCPTGARRAEQERAAAAQLASAEAVKEQLLAVVSHEFRTPLASITGLARTLSTRMDDLDRDAVQACLAGIDHHAARLARLVHNVVAASGEVAVDDAAVADLGCLARDAIAEALAAHGHRTRVRIDLPRRLEARVDPVAARRVLANLCDNAVKFAPHGAVVELSGSYVGEDAVVVIANQADDVCERRLERFFEPFVQADSSDSRPVEGMGLGLHVARRLARGHGGDVRAAVCGGRAVFRLHLPARRRPTAVASPGGDRATPAWADLGRFPPGTP